MARAARRSHDGPGHTHTVITSAWRQDRAQKRDGDAAARFERDAARVGARPHRRDAEWRMARASEPSRPSDSARAQGRTSRLRRLGSRCRSGALRPPHCHVGGLFGPKFSLLAHEPCRARPTPVSKVVIARKSLGDGPVRDRRRACHQQRAPLQGPRSVQLRLAQDPMHPANLIVELCRSVSPRLTFSRRVDTAQAILPAGLGDGHGRRCA